MNESTLGSWLSFFGELIHTVAFFGWVLVVGIEKSRTLFPNKISQTFWVCLLLTGYCSPIFALDPNQPLAQLYHSSWTMKQGLNGNVTALAQTTDGYLWVGTTDGLLRFDGISFEQFRPENGALLNTYVSALMAVPNGGLWVGFFRGGATFVKNGRVTNYSDAEGFPVSSVRCFARDRSGAIWSAVVGGFARFDGQRWQKIRNDWSYPDKSAWNLLLDRDGTLWVAAGSQILFLRQGEKRFQSTGIQTRKVSALTQAPDGTIWFSNDKNKKVRSFRLDRGGKIEIVSDIDISADSALIDRDGALWIGGEGLSRIPFPDRVLHSRSKEAEEKFTEAEGLSDEGVEAILEDREGNIWVGTDGGLDRFRYRNVTSFPLRGGPFSFVISSAGDVWAGSRGNFPVVRVQDRQPVVGGPIDVLTVYRDPEGSIWYGANHSLLHWQNGRFMKIPVPSEVLKMSLSATPPDPIFASSITRDHSGNLWVAFGGSGEFRLNNGTWSFVKILPDHPDWAASYAFTDSADRVWLCWGDRIARYDHGDVRVFGVKEGLAVSSGFVAENNEQIWAGGASGLSFFQDERFHTIQSGEDTAFTSITGIVVTQSGVWLSTAHGIIHIPETEIAKVIQHPEYKVAFDLFDQLSDLSEPIQQRGDAYSSAAIQAKDGTLWFAAQRGAVRVEPTHILRNPLPPPVSIRSIVADEKTYSPFSNPTLPALAKNLRIEYAALSLSIPERVRFRYKLEGWDNEWHEAGGRREASFTNLAPKKYSFRVIACNNDGVWNEMGATLNFTVTPAWFQTIWFRAFCIAVLLVLLWCFYQLRLRQLEQKFAIGLEARVTERTRIARELHDTLLQSLHGLMFQFQAARNMLPRRPQDAIQALDGAISRTEQAIGESRSAIQGLRHEPPGQTNLAESLTTMAQDLTPEGANADMPVFRVIVEGERQVLSPLSHEEVGQIARELLRNAFQHARARKIEAEIHYDDRSFRLRIRDDGKGIDRKLMEQGGRPGHWGLTGVRERAQRIGAQLDFWSEAGAGTEVQLIIPAAIAYNKTGKGAALRLLRKAKS